MSSTTPPATEIAMIGLLSLFKRREKIAKLAAIQRSFATIEFTMDGYVVGANDNFLTLSGYTLDEVRGRHHSIFCEPGVRDTPEYAKFWKDLTLGEFKAAEFRRLAKNGREIWLQASYVPVLGFTGRPVGVLKVAVDVTERHTLAVARAAYERKLETSNAELERLADNLAAARDLAERASSAKSRFLAGMSHELRTPLNGILGYAQLLRLEGGLTDLQSARVGAMLDAGTHLLQMIHCVLDLSEIEADRADLQPAICNLHRIASACLDLVRPAAEAKGLSLGLVIAPDLPRDITTDPTRLRQVLLNLLGNAVKFTQTGAVDMNLRPAADSARLRIEVTDTGPGVSPSQRHRLFQDFGRLDTDAADAAEGAGLGLAISARLAALMGGDLDYRDNRGGGSVFGLELPFETGAVGAQPAALLPFSDLRESVPAPDHVLNVLVVDDVAMNRDIAAAFIRSAGHGVVCAEGGAEAVASAAAADFDVVMMDLRMPGMDGLEATRRIRALPGMRGQVPVMAMTAQAFRQQIAECNAAGMDGHLAKPFTLASMMAGLAGGAEAGRRRGLSPASPQPTTTTTTTTRTTTTTTPAAPAATALADAVPFGTETRVFDAASFDRTAAYLAPDMVQSYMNTLAVRSELLLRELCTPDSLKEAAGALADAAHVLAGSAGMFGFERLAVVARHFEFVVKDGTAEAGALAAALAEVLEASLTEMRRHAAAPVGV
jgi:PAS domain S-box-containing protein